VRTFHRRSLVLHDLEKRAVTEFGEQMADAILLCVLFCFLNVFFLYWPMELLGTKIVHGSFMSNAPSPTLIAQSTFWRTAMVFTQF
jgi:hypothetical protein